MQKHRIGRKGPKTSWHDIPCAHSKLAVDRRASDSTEICGRSRKEVKGGRACEVVVLHGVCTRGGAGAFIAVASWHHSSCDVLAFYELRCEP
jgi:hypothetical protein